MRLIRLIVGLAAFLAANAGDAPALARSGSSVDIALRATVPARCGVRVLGGAITPRGLTVAINQTCNTPHQINVRATAARGSKLRATLEGRRRWLRSHRAVFTFHSSADRTTTLLLEGVEPGQVSDMGLSIGIAPL